MSKKENPKTKNRWYTAILYHEDTNFESYMKAIQDNFYYVTYIDHDKDYLEDGTPKKLHRHVLFSVGDNARHVKAVAEQIGIPENYLEGCNKDKMLLYLLHLNAPTKTLYPLSAVHGLLKADLEELVQKQTSEKKRIKAFKDYLKIKQPRTMYQLLEMAIETNNLDLLKKYQFLFSKIVDEFRTNR